MVADKLPLGVKFLNTQLNLTSEKIHLNIIKQNVHVRTTNVLNVLVR